MTKIGVIGIGIIGVALFSACSQNVSGFSPGSYDADTFREKHDPDPNVDYSKKKKKIYKNLRLRSGTYDASTFREKYDPDPNVDYGKGKGVAIGSHNSSSSSGFSDADSSEFWNTLGMVAVAVLNGAHSHYTSKSSSYQYGTSPYQIVPYTSYKDKSRPNAYDRAYGSNSSWSKLRRSHNNAYDPIRASSAGSPKYNMNSPMDQNRQILDIDSQISDMTNLNRTIDRSTGITNFRGY